MLANHNLKVSRTLIRRDMRFHPVKYGILAFAAALVTALYSFVFLLGSSVESAFLLNYQYSYGSSSHILYTGLTKREADRISESAKVQSTVRISVIGQLSEPMLGQRQVQLAVSDREYAETVLSVPTTGRLPEEPDEIAIDEFTLDSLGVPHELGSPVAVKWRTPEGEERTAEFVLCGWWASPTNFSEACAWIAAEAAEALAPGYGAEDSGQITLGVTLHQPRKLEEQAEEIPAEQGVTGCTFTVNLAYNEARRQQAREQSASYYMPALLVVLCGYLMIYSIVHVAAERDSKFFGELKALGMTPRQLCRLLTEQGVRVTLLGMLPGWGLGFLLHLWITSRVITGMEQNPALYFLSWEPFAAAAACSLLTVLPAYLMPALRLSRLTPAQVERSNWGWLHRADLHFPARFKGKHSYDGRVPLTQLAFRTLGQRRGRTLLSAGSLLLAMLLLSSVWIRYVSLKEELYLAAMFPWDYTLADGSAYLSVQQYNENNQGITGETVTELKSRPEAVRVSALQSREVGMTASQELRERVTDFYNQPYDETMTLRDTQAGFPDWCGGLERFEQSGEYVGLVIGMDGAYLDYLMEYSPFTSGSFDAEKFASGEYVLAGGAYHEGHSTPIEGEQITIAGRAFTVLGSVMHDTSYIQGDNSREASFHISYIVPSEVFEELFPGQGYRQLAVDIDEKQQEAFEAYLDEYEQGLNRGVGITRRSEYQDAFQKARLNMVLSDLVIGLVMLGIALLNFINMLMIKTVSRRREFAVYESLGMTRAQLKRLLLLEGAFHGALMAVILAPATASFDLFVMPVAVASMGSRSAEYTCSLLPLWLVLLALAVLAAAVPLICMRFVVKGSVNERIR